MSDRTVANFLRSPKARPIRFISSGSAAAAVQLAILELLTLRHWAAIPADILALLLSTQLNFVLSYVFTWGDRRMGRGTSRSIARLWLAYQSSVAGAALLNLAVFLAVRETLPTPVASALGTIVAASINFVTGDRLVFRSRPADVGA